MMRQQGAGNTMDINGAERATAIAGPANAMGIATASAAEAFTTARAPSPRPGSSQGEPFVKLEQVASSS